MTAEAPSTRSQTLDFSELSARYSRSQIREFNRWARSTDLGSHRWRGIARSIGVAVVLSVVLLVIAVFTLIISAGMLAISNWLAAIVASAVTAAFVTWSVMKLLSIWRRDVRFPTGLRRWMTLDRFALANERIYVPEIASPGYEGSIFQLGQGQRAYDVVATTTGRYVEVGNFEYRGESGLERSLNRCGYVRVEVDRTLPHLYLRSRRSRRIGAAFARSQEFTLEGDFPQHFRLFAPGGYERDALYLLTPDIMATLIDEASDLDIEFIGEHIYFYSARRFRMREAATHLLVERLVDTVARSALRQANAYSDFRVGGGYVTTRGSRLRSGITLVSVASLLLVIARVVQLIHPF